MNARIRFATLLSALTLVACGGGGGDSGGGSGSSNARPTASFTATPDSGNPPLDVAFDASSSSDSDGSIVSYDWDFGDGSTGEGETIDHTYTSAGSYSAELTVTDDDGATRSTSTTITVNAAPSAAFSADLERGEAPLTVDFDASASTDDGSITSYAWDFDDGSNDTGETVSHEFAAAGSYDVMLTVTDDGGLTDQTTVTIRVDPPLPNQSPTATFTFSEDDAVVRQVDFDASGSSDPDGTIVSYAWSLGDTSNDSGNTVEHTYSSNGSYVVSLTVTDDDGATATVSKTVTVDDNADPVASFTASPLSGDPPLTVTFDASGSSDSDGSIVSYSWDFADDTTDTGSTVSHEFTSAGEYVVTLTIEDDSGATDSANRTISVSFGGPYQLSGTMVSADTNAVDSDTNDPFSPYSDNGFVNTAQVLPNPVLLGGFAAAEPTQGDLGDRFADSADDADLYRVGLAEGQTVQMLISDWDSSSPTSVDLDLHLWNSTGDTLIASSISITAKESVIVPSDGEYLVQVDGYDGFSNYILSVGQNIEAAASGDRTDQFYFEHDWVPGQAIVRTHPRIAGSKATFGGDRAPLEDAGYQRLAGAPDREQLLALPQPVGDRSSLEGGEIWDRLSAEQRAELETLWEIKALRQQESVWSAEPNYRIHALRTPDDPSYDEQWHYPLMKLPQAWDLSIGDEDPAVVAVIDTGVFLSHSDLQGQLTADGYDFISSTDISNDGDGIDANPDDPGDEGRLSNSSWHGTHVAGTVAAATDNATGVAGVAWGAKVMPIRVLGVGGGTGYDVLQGVRYAAGLANDSGTLPSQAADIINLSLGGGGFSASEQSVYTSARNAGTIIIAAAGNESTSIPSYPASYDGVVSVSSVGPEKQLAYYSNFGDEVDVAAPGGDMSNDVDGDGNLDGVLSTLVGVSSGSRTSSYAFYQGTSMAAPHMAGVVALMESVYPALDPDTLDLLIEGGLITEDIGAAGRDNAFGWGLIDAQLAVQQAANLASGGTIPSQMTVNPGTLNFGSITSELTVTVDRTGTEPLSVASVSAPATWLSVVADSVDGDGFGTYTVTVDRTDLTDARYNGRVTFTDSEGDTADITVVMNVGTTSGSGDTGQVYLLLIDVDTDAVLEQFEDTPTLGEYLYSFTDVDGGEYYLIAGTDSDNDFFICDAGEACGAWPVLDLLEALTLDSDETEVDFLVSFEASISVSSASADDGAFQGFPLRWKNQP